MKATLGKFTALVIGSVVCTEVLAQFSAHGGPDDDRNFLIFLGYPWIAIFLIIAFSWLGPKILRPALRRISICSFFAYTGFELLFFIAMPIAYIINGGPLLYAHWTLAIWPILFFGAFILAGYVILAFMIIHIIFIAIFKLFFLRK